MLTARSDVYTDKTNVYLKKFCWHFMHKLPSEFNASIGCDIVPFGDCRLASQDITPLLMSKLRHWCQ